MGRLILLRRWVAAQLRSLAAWIDAPDPFASPLLQRARVLVALHEEKPMSAEAKRHQVYGTLVKEFPAHAKRAISRAIEDALV